ncbi:MBL fold metallo-hydrolase [Maribacter sp. 2307UL18-2]|uniref:MBL fold metallo-hydrolase n=1 Tax=Maribacter sp. 2307UL18-2 TaxID=3386274 RepID=UPI0039BD0F18
MYKSFVFFLFTCLFTQGQEKIVSIHVLGIVQDAGAPHIACEKACCSTLFKNSELSPEVVSLGVIDEATQKTFLFEATPDITTQLRALRGKTDFKTNDIPDGIFLTHAHIGHYTGLMYLGKEATNAKAVSVYAMPKMKRFLEENGPWSQLVHNSNIQIEALKNKAEIQLTSALKVIPFTVPHRDEYSETVGYTIIGPQKRILFIPDIDKWEKWKTSIVAEIAKVDYAFLDATFYDAQEINNRAISEIPHPFVIESMELFKNLPKSEKAKVYFLHLNHTNPLLNPNSEESKEVLKKGYHIARKHMRFEL